MKFVVYAMRKRLIKLLFLVSIIFALLVQKNLEKIQSVLFVEVIFYALFKKIY